jgi:D-glycero-alpha-D-manno-heptose-7-phosphate kinase
MIISRTPLRISFVGGGSDISSFYKTEPGAVVTTTINKYVFITVNKRFDGKYRLSYTDTEIVDDVEDFKHQLGRETLKYFKIKHGIEVHSIGDIPAQTGLANSGAYTVGLINALRAYKGERSTPEQLANLASIIEIEKAKRPIGKQDQYVQAYGGLNFIQFNPDESVVVEPIRLSSAKTKKLESSLLLFYTGRSGSSAKVLAKQTKKLAEHVDKRAIISQMVGIAKEMKTQLQKGNIDSFGELLHENWLLKKKMGSGVSNKQIDAWYETALQKGAIGGKICGAGGRGFLLLYAPEKKHNKIIRALSDLQYVDFSFEQKGSMIVYK